MPRINPQNLRLLRNQANLTLDRLAEKSNIDRVTISRIENGATRNSRSHTLEQLARALGADVKVLIGPDITGDERERKPNKWKSKYEAELTHDVRNALALVALRYRVSPANILQLAPFLFLWAAEKSLAQREEKLDEIEQGWEALQDISLPGHLPHTVTGSTGGGQKAIEAERRSIAARDLFGYTLDFEDDLPDHFDDEKANPFAVFLSGLASETRGQAEFEYWSRYFDGPEFSLAPEMAHALVEGDSEAATQIVTGAAPLHEIPADVRKEGGSAIAEWARARGEEFSKSLEEILLSEMI